MWTFLEWLWNKASRAYNLLDWIYSKVVDAANNAYSWAVNKAAKALQDAKDWATGKLADLKAGLLSTVYAIRDYLHGLFDWVYSKALEWYNAAKAFATSLWDEAKTTVQGWIQAAKDWAKARVDDAKASLTALIAYVVDQLNKRLAVLEVYRDFLASLIKVITPANLNALITFFNLLFGQVVMFFANPIAWIYGVLWQTFTTFLCYILAVGMGTTIYKLPPPPIFGGSGEGGPFPPGPDLPPGSGELGKPVSPVWVSGYVFGPGHPGVDLGIGGGQAIYAAHDGEIEFSGWSNVGYGNTITLRGSPYWTRYAHLEGFMVEKGDTVHKGQQIAKGDTTGNSTGNHLHFELKINGVFVNPLLYI